MIYTVRIYDLPHSFLFWFPYPFFFSIFFSSTHYWTILFTTLTDFGQFTWLKEKNNALDLLEE